MAKKPLLASVPHLFSALPPPTEAMQTVGNTLTTDTTPLQITQTIYLSLVNQILHGALKA